MRVFLLGHSPRFALLLLKREDGAFGTLCGLYQLWPVPPLFLEEAIGMKEGEICIFLSSIYVYGTEKYINGAEKYVFTSSIRVPEVGNT